MWKRLPEWEDTAVPPPPSSHPVLEAEARARLAEMLGPEAEQRPGQADYAGAATAAFAPRETQGDPHFVLAEAGTGTGKTLGYLAPATVWAQKNGGAVWISTFTRHLQRQVDGEIARLLPDPAQRRNKVVVRKGRENYLCLLNLEDAVNHASAGLTHQSAIPLGLIARWATVTDDGDVQGGDLPGWFSELYGAALVASLADRRGECIHAACPHWRRCFVEHTIRRARTAELVVANHALVMTQAAWGGLDDSAVPSRYVFDEGHHLFDAADSAFSATLSGAETAELRRWLLGAEGGRSRARGLKRRLDELVAGHAELEAPLDAALQAARALPAGGWPARLSEEGPELAGLEAGRPNPTEAFLRQVRRQVLARAADALPGGAGLAGTEASGVRPTGSRSAGMGQGGEDPAESGGGGPGTARTGAAGTRPTASATAAIGPAARGPGAMGPSAVEPDAAGATAVEPSAIEPGAGRPAPGGPGGAGAAGTRSVQIRSPTTRSSGSRSGGSGLAGPTECDVYPVHEDLADTAVRLGRALARIAEPLGVLRARLLARLEDEAEDLDTATRTRIEALGRTLTRRALNPLTAWQAMLGRLQEPPPDPGQRPDHVLFFRLEHRRDYARGEAAPGEPRRVDWSREVDVGLCRHWLDPTIPFTATLAAPAQGVLVTSATLRDAGDGDAESAWAIAEARVGAPHLPSPAIRAAVASPFDYAAQTRAFVVTDVAAGDIGQLASAYRALFLAAGGGGLGLFTAIRRLQAVHERIAPELEAAGIPLYAQHVDAMGNATLVDIFRAEEESCLLGTDAMRDGVDVPGRALRLVVFERVPWPRPDILHRERRIHLSGGDPKGYDDRIVRLRLRQAFGRLIRRGSDRGVFVLLDRQAPSRVLSAFPSGVTVRRVGLAQAVMQTREFLALPEPG